MKPPGIRSQTLTLAAFVLAALLSAPALAQQPGPARTRTLLTQPPDATVTLRGASEITATSPVDLEPAWSGKFEVLIEAPGYAAARGRIILPEMGTAPYATSEPSGMTAGLLLRSLNFPGAPQILDHRLERGLAFGIAGAGGLGAVIRDHLEYRSNFDDPDPDEQRRAYDFRYARNRWALYTGAVWGMSAVDYIVRARMDLVETSATRFTLRAPKLSRAGILWRSILVPGAGQDYANRRGRGLAWLGTTLAAGAAYVVALESHNRILSKLALAEQLRAGASPSEIPDRQADVDHFTKLEDDSRRLVDGLAMSTLVIYAANVLDAGLVSAGSSSSTTKGFSLTAPVGARRAAVGVRYRF